MRRSHATYFRPCLEAMECRQLLASFTVANTNNAGAGSLRQAIQDANNNAGADTIDFNIPGFGPHTISPTSPLPAITDPVIIDGYTQPNTSPNTLADENNAVLLIELEGSFAGTNTQGIFLNNVSGCTIRGLVINRFAQNGIYILGGGGHVIEGNFIGPGPNGTVAFPNAFNGVDISGATGVTVGGASAAARNLLSGNGDNGVYLEFSASGNTVLGNFIGIDRLGSGDLGNGNNGVAIETGANINVIGGATPGAKNIISGNGDNGVFIRGAGVSGNVISRNYIGTDVFGIAAVGNGESGVLIIDAPSNTIGGADSSYRNTISGNGRAGVHLNGSATTGTLITANHIGTNAGATAKQGNNIGILIDQAAQSNTIGGTTAQERNVISGNKRNGVALGGNFTAGNVVQGNYIGTDFTGTQALGNPTGISIFRLASNNIIGGTVAGAGNVISGNNTIGISITSFGATGNLVLGNRVGTVASGNGSLPNGAGVAVAEGAFNNTIGGLAVGAGNTISHNGADGIRIGGGSGNAIRGNEIANSGGLGIILVDGGNNNQPAPVLTSVVSGGGTTTIDGMLTAAPNTAYGIDFFASMSCDSSGFGEGKFYFGSSTETTDGTGVVTFSETFNVPVLPTHVVTTTATSPSNDTSEFSACLVVPAPLPPVTGQRVAAPEAWPLAQPIGAPSRKWLVGNSRATDKPTPPVPAEEVGHGALQFHRRSEACTDGAASRTIYKEPEIATDHENSMIPIVDASLWKCLSLPD